MMESNECCVGAIKSVARRLRRLRRPAACCESSMAACQAFEWDGVGVEASGRRGGGPGRGFFCGSLARVGVSVCVPRIVVVVFVVASSLARSLLPAVAC